MFHLNGFKFVRVNKVITLCALCLTQLPVFASSQDISNSIQIDPVIVTADLIPTPSSQVIQDHVYISNEQIRAAGQQSLAELLQQQAGIQVATSGDSGNLATVFTRGTNGNHTLLLVDGVRVELTSTGGGIWNAIPLTMIDHIEVVYGPEAIYYGSDAIGGVVQVFTKQGNGAPKVSAMAGYGSYGTYMTSASLAGSVNGVNTTKYSFGVSEEKSSGFNTVATNNPSNFVQFGALNPYPQTATGYQRYGANLNLEQSWATNQSFGIHLISTRDVYQFPYNVGPITGVSNPEIDSNYNNLTSFSLFSKNQINQFWESNVQLSVSSNYSKQVNSISNDQVLTPQYDYQWNNAFNIGKDRLSLNLEHRVQYLNADYSPTYDYCTAGVNCTQNISRSIDSLALIYHMQFDKSSLDLASRADGYSGYGAKLTGSVLYGYNISKELKAHASYGSAFSEPTLDELYFPNYGMLNLAPEFSKTAELGLDYKKKNYLLGVTLYQTKINNLIQTIYPSNLNYLIYQNGIPANIASVTINGLSTKGQYIWNSFTFRGSFDVLHSTDQSTDLQLPLRAQEVGNMGVDYRLNKLLVGINLLAASRRYATETSTGYTKPLGGYQLLSLNSSYQLNKSWSLFGRWDNVTNMPYQLQYGYNTPGSNVFFGVRYDQ
ncbi:MAG: TonB-dependent receptor [Betaproteobacteria bacterium]|nr:TonB-dependent receptor [Betaproteobacteria bacterium]